MELKQQIRPVAGFVVLVIRNEVRFYLIFRSSLLNFLTLFKYEK